MGIGASSFLGVQSPASEIEKQISYYNQALCRAFGLVFPLENISNFIFGIINQFPEKYLLTSFLLFSADLIWKNSLAMFKMED